MTSTTITKMDKPTVTRLGGDIRAALELVAEEYGMTVKVGGGSYDPEIGTFKPKIEFALADSADRAIAAWAPAYGLPADATERTFTTHGQTFRVSGVKPRATKRPIIATDVASGKEYAFPASLVASLLEAS